MYAELVKEYPTNAKVWLSYGHVLKTEGRQDESIAAYRRAISRACEMAFGMPKDLRLIKTAVKNLPGSERAAATERVPPCIRRAP